MEILKIQTPPFKIDMDVPHADSDPFVCRGFGYRDSIVEGFEWNDRRVA